MAPILTPNNPGGTYANVQTPDRTHGDPNRLAPKSWTVKYWYLGSLAQFIIAAGLFVYSFGLMLRATPKFTTIRTTLAQWWGATVTVKNGRTSFTGGHSEMATPTYFFLFLVLPLIVSYVCMEFLGHFNVRRMTARYVLTFARIMRRKPRVLKWVSPFSYGELIVLAIMIGGNVMFFAYMWGSRTVTTFNAFLKSAANIMGYNCIYCMALLFVPVTRNTAWMEVMNISYANAVKYHRWLGVLTVFTGMVHTVFYYWMWIRTSSWKAQALPCFDCDLGVKAGKKVWINVFGELAIFCFLAISATSIPWVRRKMYNTFYYVHQLLFLAVLFTILHFEASIWWLLPSCAVYTMTRVVSHTNSFTPVEVKEFTCLDDDIIKIVISRSSERDGNYKVGQFVYLNVPTLSKLQWHAFTISSSPRTNATTLTILLKSLGDWTQDLVQYADECKKSNTLPTMYMDGYYGASLEMYNEYSTICLIGGGIGATPMFAILEDLVAQLSAHKTPTQRVVFVFSFRELALLEEIHPTLAKLKELDPHEQFFSMQFFLTRAPSTQALNQPLNSHKNHVQPTHYATKNGKEMSACPFIQPLTTNGTKSAAYTSTLMLAVLLVMFMEYGGGKIDVNHAALWPVQLFVETSLMAVSAIVAYGIIFAEKKFKKPSGGDYAYHAKNVEAYDIYQSNGATTPKAHLSSDVHTYGDLVNHYKVSVGHRPDMQVAMTQVFDAHCGFTSGNPNANGNPAVGVFVSGPEAMKSGMLQAVANIGTQHFDVHEEEFEL